MNEISEQEKQFLQGLFNPLNWKPNLSTIANACGLSVSTVKDRYEKMRQRGQLEVQITERTLTDVINEGKNDTDK